MCTLPATQIIISHTWPPKVMISSKLESKRQIPDLNGLQVIKYKSNYVYQEVRMKIYLLNGGRFETCKCYVWLNSKVYGMSLISVKHGNFWMLFFKSQFNYYPFIWMRCNVNNNMNINRLWQMLSIINNHHFRSCLERMALYLFLWTASKNDQWKVNAY